MNKPQSCYRLLCVLCLPLLLLQPSGSSADEGMWTLHDFPASAVKARYGVNISPEWLSSVQQSTARLDGGCTGSFASSQGLVLTNNHCTWGCVRDCLLKKEIFPMKASWPRPWKMSWFARARESRFCMVQRRSPKRCRRPLKACPKNWLMRRANPCCPALNPSAKRMGTSLVSRSICITAESTSSISIAVTMMCDWFSHQSSPLRPLEAIRITLISRVGTLICPFCGSIKTANPLRPAISFRGLRRVRKMGRLCLYPGTWKHQPPGDGHRTGAPAQSFPSAPARYVLRVPWPNARVGQDQRRSRPPGAATDTGH